MFGFGVSTSLIVFRIIFLFLPTVEPEPIIDTGSDDPLIDWIPSPHRHLHSDT